jgi:ribosomal-protein-alanine N-acetyltransferase
MNIPILETPDLVLRPWKMEDCQDLFDILLEPGILDYFPPTAFSLERTGRYISHQLDHWQARGYGHWAVTLKTDGRLIGWNGLEYLPETGETEVAYLLSHQAWGRGYATQAARSAIDFGFKLSGLKSIIGLVHPMNAGSIKVLEKCGLTLIDRKEYWGLELLRYRVDAHEMQD